MKKTLIALAVLSAANVVNAAEILKTDSASVDFYGQLREELKQVDWAKKSDDTHTTLSSGSSRAGVNSIYTINDDLDVLATVEFGIGQSNSGTSRKHYLGFASKEWGTVTVGKQSVLTDDVWGVENDWIGLGYSVLPEMDDYGMYWLQDAMIKYTLEGSAGWFKAAYSYKNGNDDPTTAEIFAGTTFGNIELYGGVGYLEDKTTSTKTKDITITSGGATHTVESKTTTVNSKELKHGMLTVNYKGDGWNLGTTYWHAQVDDNAKNTKLTSDSVAVAGSYSFTEKLSLYGGYEYIKDLQEEGNDFNGVYSGLLYKYASWTKVYAETGFNDSDKIGNDSYWGIGVRIYW
ncbi:Porin-like protein H precursor [Vibrio ruber DSM 16370]|uniref:Porin-like protein H n=1 Tax=Vibrio ruber (strain DSM 16370 / JCM 11486 / BCRC 17186 / CECT 7878 / LMG 23124 / VR1) TaxID=1123498 RepID=A0A1R4LGN7_VIBR1|nr:porin [Vibrio ruber]SJN55464.1 Porin-like protein H precursor [Vibrio ruber DSM 16370]